MQPRRPARRSLSLLVAALALVVTVPLVPPAAARAADGTVSDTEGAFSATAIADAEHRMLTLLNQDRAAAGLVAYRVDTRIAAIARARAEDMAAKDYFSHTQPDGRKVYDYLTAAGITWYAAAEIIAWNSWPDLVSSAATANDSWMGSTGHRAIILSTGYNYVGVGAARGANGKIYWVGVMLKGPDRTGASGRMTRLYRTSGSVVDGKAPLRIAWTGADVRLQVLTAGLRNFDVQRRIDGGSWVTVWSGTTATAVTRYYRLGHRYEFRVRARDNRGNVGPWSAPFGVRI